MKLTILCLVLLTVNVFAFNIFVKDKSSTDPNDDRVKIDFFYESLCPYCQQFMERSLKTAANTKVNLFIFRISGKFVTLISILMAMLADKKLEMMIGITPANMVQENVKETSLKLVQLSSILMILMQKFFPSSSVSKPLQVIGLSKERSVHLNMDSTGIQLTPVQLQNKAGNMKMKWEK